MKIIWDRDDIYGGLKLYNQYYEVMVCQKVTEDKEAIVVNINSGQILSQGSLDTVAEFLTKYSFMSTRGGL